MFARAPANKFDKKKGNLFQAGGGTFCKTSDQNNEGIYQIQSMSQFVGKVGEGRQSHFRCNEPNPEYTHRPFPFTIDTQKNRNETRLCCIGYDHF